MDKSMNDPLISIIVPSFNQGEFLDKALSSIFNQNYPYLEVIVMDGGSKDNSVDIIKKYEKQLSYWQSQPDGGQSAAINAGMRRANGLLVTWLNSDDYYLENAIKHMVMAYHRNPYASFYAGNGYRVTRSGMIKEPFFTNEAVTFDRNGLMYGVDYIMQPSTFMNRAYVEQVNYLDIDLHYGMDWDLFIKLSKLADPVIFFDMIAASREYEQTKTASGYFHRIEELRNISKKHTQLELSPGVILYLLADLRSLCHKQPDYYSSAYTVQLERLWKDTVSVLYYKKLDSSGYIFNKANYLDKKKSFDFSFLVKYREQLIRLFTLISNEISIFIINLVKDSSRFVCHIAKQVKSSRLVRGGCKVMRVTYFRLLHGLYAK